jgi:MFS family permease
LNSTSLRPGRFYGWIALTGAALVLFAQNGGVLNCFGAFLPALCRDLGWTRGEVSLGFTILMIPTMLASPFAGFFIARFGARISIILSNLLITLALLGLSVQSKQSQFYAAYAIIGLGAGFGGPMAAYTVASSWFRRKAPLAMSITTAAPSIGGMVLIPTFMMLIDHFGWRYAYAVLASLVFLLGAVVPGLIVRNGPEDMGQVPDGAHEPDTGAMNADTTPHLTSVDFTVMQAVKTKAFWLLNLFGCIPMYVAQFIGAHQIAFFMGVGISSQRAAAAAGTYSACALIGTLGLGVLALRYGTKRIATIAVCLAPLALILALFVRSTPLAFAFAILAGLAVGGSFTAVFSFLATYFGRSNYSKIMGVNSLFGVAGTLGAPVGGYVYDATGSYTLPFIIAIFVSCLGAACVLVLKPPTHPDLQVQEAKQ